MSWKEHCFVYSMYVRLGFRQLKIPGIPEIPVGVFPESEGNKQEVGNPPTRISGKPGNLFKVFGNPVCLNL
jgi:hypothetical protein